MQGSNSKMCDVSTFWSVTVKFIILNMFISIATVYPSFLVKTNVVKPVTIMLVRPVYYVGADLGLDDTISAEERAEILRLNGHHSSLKFDQVILPIIKVISNDIDILRYV
jgi:hypothetical protein